MSTSPGSTLAAMEAMSDGAPAPVEELPDELDEPDPNGEPSPPEEPDPNGEPPVPDEPAPGEAELALDVDWTGQTSWPRPAPATTAARSTTAASATTTPLRFLRETGWGGGPEKPGYGHPPYGGAPPAAPPPHPPGAGWPGCAAAPQFVAGGEGHIPDGGVGDPGPTAGFGTVGYCPPG
jgi:hypothetical protein